MRLRGTRLRYLPSAGSARLVVAEIARVAFLSTVVWSVIALLHAPRADFRIVLAGSVGCAVLWARPVLALLDRGSRDGRPLLRLFVASGCVDVMTFCQGIVCLYPAFLLAMVVITMQEFPRRRTETAMVIVTLLGTTTAVVAIRAGLPGQIIPVPVGTTIALATLGCSLFTIRTFAATGRALAANAAALEASSRALAEEQRLRADEVTERAEQLHFVAHHDGLTGLLNRSGITAVLSEKLQATTAGSGLAAIYLDLDGFKAVNDAWGHGVGDGLLEVVAERMRTAVRPGDFVGRMGGDEFLLVLPQIGTGEVADIVTDRVIRAVAEPINVDGHTLTVGVSAGVACCDDPGLDADGLIALADTAMYAAKMQRRAGRAEKASVATKSASVLR